MGCEGLFLFFTQGFLYSADLHDRNFINTHTLTAGNSVEENQLCSHMGSIRHHVDFVLGSWRGEVCSMSGSTDSDVGVPTLKAPPGNISISSGTAPVFEIRSVFHP